MKRLIFVFMLSAYLSIFSITNVDAAALGTDVASTADGAAISIVAGTFGSGKPAAADSFQPSSGVRVGINVDALGLYFVVAAKHTTGTKVYASHSLSNQTYFLSSTSGAVLPTVPTATSTAAVSGYTVLSN